MTKQKTFDIDPETGIATVRDMTDKEQAAFDAAVAAIGLTQEEIEAL
jgi:hypothetical protein